MIDWVSVGYSALWIFGLSIMLAAVSLADYQAHVEQCKLRIVLRRSSFQAGLNLGLALVCLGLVGSARATWEQVVWIVLTIAFGLQAGQAYRSMQQTPGKQR